MWKSHLFAYFVQQGLNTLGTTPSRVEYRILEKIRKIRFDKNGL